ncbi:MAG: hypothetical protein GY832_11710 [Chloroflexi bacterium]|nr:hypothetical protein [Chloroflexota bacterium]
MKTQHTAGPWKHGEVGSGFGGYGIGVFAADAGGCMIASVELENLDDERIGHCDARLISASPDLLEACRVALEYMGDDDEGNCPICGGGQESGLAYHAECPCRKVRAAIAKATETPS